MYNGCVWLILKSPEDFNIVNKYQNCIPELYVYKNDKKKTFFYIKDLNDFYLNKNNLPYPINLKLIYKTTNIYLTDKNKDILNSLDIKYYIIGEKRFDASKILKSKILKILEKNELPIVVCIN